MQYKRTRVQFEMMSLGAAFHSSPSRFSLPISFYTSRFTLSMASWRKQKQRPAEHESKSTKAAKHAWRFFPSWLRPPLPEFPPGIFSGPIARHSDLLYRSLRSCAVSMYLVRASVVMLTPHCLLGLFSWIVRLDRLR